MDEMNKKKTPKKREMLTCSRCAGKFWPYLKNGKASYGFRMCTIKPAEFKEDEQVEENLGPAEPLCGKCTRLLLGWLMAGTVAPTLEKLKGDREVTKAEMMAARVMAEKLNNDKKEEKTDDKD